ncbi:MAG: hypothetical protein Q4E65_09235 [Clostridia bacterium]|nr:hypothetical protein [Clostridia bacterium]
MWVILLLLFACLCLCACGAQEEAVDATDAALYADFTRAGTRVGGGVPIEDANAKTLTASAQGEDIALTLSFVGGSRLSGSADEKTLLAAPAYEVYMLPAPARLVIELPAIAYWDYARTVDLSNIPGIQGCFLHMLADGDTVSIFVQLAQESMFRVEEAEDSLLIHIKPIPTPQVAQEEEFADLVEAGTHFFVTADAYRDYCSGVISREMDMQPTLTSDRERIVLISAPFDTPAEAERYKEQTLALTANTLPAQWSAIELAQGALPPYAEEMNYKAAYGHEVYRQNGEVKAGDVFLPDGLYLCTLPGKNGVLYSKRVTTDDVTGDVYNFEMLYTMDLQGNTKRLFPYEFETIESTQYAPDGRKLAVLERAAESTHLYVFDVEAKELLVDLSTVGFGDMISAYTWDALGSTIYAVSGSSAMQVHQYDFNVPDEAKRYSIVDKNGADEGSIDYCDGNLYFVQSDLSAGAVIYRIKPEGGVRKTFTQGDSFVISPDGAYMAVNRAANEMEDAQGKDTFILLDMKTGESRVVTDAFAAYSYFWSRDCTKLYYFENRLSGGEGEGANEEDTQTAVAADPFPYTLWVYDLITGQNAALMDFPMTSVYMSGLSERFYLCYMDEATMGSAIRATYDVSAVQIGR